MRILVVEDEKKVAKALREGLEAERYEVCVACTGEEGFFLANQDSFDLVLLLGLIARREQEGETTEPDLSVLRP